MSPTLRARSQPNLHRFSWVKTFSIENDIGYNILKDDKNSYYCWREFKSLLQEHESFSVDFQTHSRFSQKNARQPNVHQRTRCCLTVTSMQKIFQRKKLQFGCATAQKLPTVRYRKLTSKNLCYRSKLWNSRQRLYEFLSFFNMLQLISFSIQKVQAQLKRLSIGREWALSVGPLRGYPRARVWTIASKSGGRVCPALSQLVCNQIFQIFFQKKFQTRRFE